MIFRSRWQDWRVPDEPTKPTKGPSVSFGGAFPECFSSDGEATAFEHPLPNPTGPRLPSVDDPTMGARLPPLSVSERSGNEPTKPTKAPFESARVDYAAVYVAITATTSTAEDLAACSWWYDLGNRGLPAELVARKRCCEALAQEQAPEPTYRAAVEQLVARLSEIRDAYWEAQRPEATEDLGADPPATPLPVWRFILDASEPVAGPVRLDSCTVVEDVPRFIACTLRDLERAVAHKNAGHEGACTDLIDEYLAGLVACGCRARVEALG